MSAHTFYFKSTQLPTQYNLSKHLALNGYHQSTNPSTAHFTDKNLILDENYSQQLEYKHLLVSLIKAHCPKIMPSSYLIDDNNYKGVLEQLAKENLSGWILKPALLNNGVGIKLFNTLSEVHRHYLETRRYNGSHVLQRYITKPHLLNGHKYTFRMFVIITDQGHAYVYPKGYFNICRTPYLYNDLTQLEAHLTNEHLHPDNSPNNWQIPTHKCPNFEIIYTKMKKSITEVITALNKQFSSILKNKTNAFSIFGFDFLLDEQLKLWLLEINHGPCFPITEDHVLQQHLYHELWQALIAEFVLPIMSSHTLDKGSKQFDPIFHLI